MNECIFCKIAQKEIPADVVYEDEDFIAFLDINPVNEGHTLVIPKKHFENIFDIEESTYAELQKVVKKVAEKVKGATSACGVNIMQNNNPCAGQVVFHIHIHIIPRFEGDGYELWHGNPYESDEKRKELAEKIKNYN